MVEALDLDGLQHLLWSFARHRLLTVAARTGVLRRLADAPGTSDQVARDLVLDRLATGKIVRALHALGVLAAEDDTYRVVDGLAPYFREGPDDVVPFFEHSHHMYEGWGANLEDWLRGGDWQVGARDPEGTRRFGAAMRALGGQIAKRVATRIDLDGVHSMLDVGGGFGQFARAMCHVAPGLHATVLDIPAVAELARAEIEGSADADRISFVGGDYLESDYGSGFDLVLFANVLHQESCDHATEMVRRGAAALAPGGRVAIVDFQIDDEQREHPLGTLFAINMRSFGDTHCEPTIRGWLEAVGLGNTGRTDLDNDRWLIEGRRKV